MTTAPDSEAPIVRLRQATRSYGEGPTTASALDHIDLDSYVVLLGSSGSDKTTLLNVIGGIDSLTEGSVEVDGALIGDLDRAKLTEFRRDHVAFIFQLYYLVPTLTAVENVQLIAELTGGDQARATSALEAAGTADLAEEPLAVTIGERETEVATLQANGVGQSWIHRAITVENLVARVQLVARSADRPAPCRPARGRPVLPRRGRYGGGRPSSARRADTSTTHRS